MTKAEVAQILKRMRLDANMTQKEAAAKLGRNQKTLASWETGQSQPDANTLFLLCDLYHTNVDEAFGLKKYNQDSFSQPEQSIIKKYRTLDKHGKTVVNLVLDEEALRMEVLQRHIASEKATQAVDEQEEQAPDPESDPEYIDMIVYNQAAAAGFGNYLDDSDDYDTISFPVDDVPYGADFGIRISGDSMEPDIPDGSIVWIEKRMEIQSGQIGVFIYEGCSYCKRLFVDYEKQIVLLESINPEYDDIIITDDIRTVGRVLL